MWLEIRASCHHGHRHPITYSISSISIPICRKHCQSVLIAMFHFHTKHQRNVFSNMLKTVRFCLHLVSPNSEFSASLPHKNNTRIAQIMTEHQSIDGSPIWQDKPFHRFSSQQPSPANDASTRYNALDLLA